MQKTFIIIMLVILSLIGWAWWSTRVTQKSSPDVASTNGLHWHSELSLYVKGEKQPIPAGIGLGAVHLPIHTHDSDGIIHMEFNGRVTKDDLKLTYLFKNWKKDFKSFGSNVKMTVNGKDNTDYENYEMKDGDKIELRYE